MRIREVCGIGCGWGEDMYCVFEAYRRNPNTLERPYKKRLQDYRQCGPTLRA